MDARMDAEMEVVPAGTDRAMTRDLLSIAASRHGIHGFFDCDVTEARRRLHGTSFTAFVIHCFACAVAAEPHLNAMRRGGKLYRFRTVNVATMVERESAGHKTVAGLVVDDAAAKSLAEVHDEIRAAQTAPVSKLARDSGVSLYARMPAFLRRFAMRRMLSIPATAHRMGLLTGVTAIGMFSDGPGWGLPLAPSTVMLTIGGIGKRLALVRGRLEEREFVCLTLSFDHDIVDGAPAARLAARLRRLIEDADGLPATERETASLSA